MKHLLVLVFGLCTALFSYGQEQAVAASCCQGEVGRCVGSAYCTACTNCSRCRHCNSGGSCGVCSRRYRSSRRYVPATKRTYSPTDRSSTGTGAKTHSLPNDPASPYYLKKLVVNVETLNLRSGPGTSYPVIGKVKKGQRLTFLAMTGNWVKVRVDLTDTVGFVHYNYVLVSNSH